MAVNKLIQYLEQVATSTDGLNDFLYGDPMEAYSYQDKQYPLLLVDRNINIEGYRIESLERIYTVRLFFYGLNDKDKESIEKVSDDYLQSLRAAFKDDGYPYKIDNENNISGFWAFYKNNSKLTQLLYTLKIRSRGNSK